MINHVDLEQMFWMNGDRNHFFYCAIKESLMIQWHFLDGKWWKMYAFISLFAMISLLKWYVFCFCVVSGQFLKFKLAFSLNWFWHNLAFCSAIIIYSSFWLKQRLNGSFHDFALHFKICYVPLAKQGFEVVSQTFSSHFSILWSYFITLLFVQYVISHYLYFFHILQDVTLKLIELPKHWMLPPVSQLLL